MTSSPATSRWEPGTTIELLALLLTVPGAVVALVTLRILLSRRRQKMKRRQSEQSSTTTPPYAFHISDSEVSLISRFQEQFQSLREEATAERREWADELSNLGRRSQKDYEDGHVMRDGWSKVLYDTLLDVDWRAPRSA